MAQLGGKDNNSVVKNTVKREAKKVEGDPHEGAVTGPVTGLAARAVCERE